jgi:hypothetical protein
MERGEMWIEDLEWIEADNALDDALGGVLVVFDEYGSVLTMRDAGGPSDCAPAGGGVGRPAPPS